MRRLVALVCITVLVAACSAAPSPPPAAQPSPTAPAAVQPSPAAPASATVPLPAATLTAASPTTGPAAPTSPPISGGSAMVVQLAVEHLATRLSLAATDIKIKSAEAVNWPDTALGCPQPGHMYAQVITPGYKIILTAAGKDYEYHSDRSRVIPCPAI